MDQKELEKSLRQVVPSGIDDIIRLRRNELTVRLATQEDIADLAPMISMLNDQMQVRATIHEWRIVALDLHHVGKQFILVGLNETTQSVWGSSTLKSADFDSNLVLTENSIYRLGTAGKGELSTVQLFHICYLFHKWGFGAKFGVPEIFY